jgi:hypothetical protein
MEIIYIIKVIILQRSRIISKLSDIWSLHMLFGGFWMHIESTI